MKAAATNMQVSWADQVVKHTSGKVLVLAPLAVSKQTVSESEKFGINGHICPLQLKVIERGINLWSNPGDVVYDPFLGIGSSVVVALRNGRRGVGTELKESYYKQAALNCAAAVQSANGDLFSFAAQSSCDNSGKAQQG